MSNVRYTTVLFDIRDKFGITNNEYILCSIIHKLSFKTGLCYASKKYLAEQVNVTEQGLYKMLNRLIEKGLIIKQEGTSFLKASDYFILESELDTKQSLGTLQKQEDTKQSLEDTKLSLVEQTKQSLEDTKQSLDYNNNNNNIRDNNNNNNNIDRNSKIKEYKDIFEESRKIYKGTKRGCNTEFEVFIKHKDWQEVLPMLKAAIQREIQYIEGLKREGKFAPEYKHFKTWLNQRCWENEFLSTDNKVINENELKRKKAMIKQFYGEIE
jgi:predicted transcriptional regulator